MAASALGREPLHNGAARPARPYTGGYVRLCYNCQFMYFDAGSPSYSEYTPGSNMTMYCQKDHWDLDGYEDKLRECLETAQHCPDYQHSNKAIELGIPDEDAVALPQELAPKPKPKPKLAPVLCVKCGTQYQTYKPMSYSDRSFTHCPKCEPVISVQAEGGFLLPEGVYRVEYE